MTFGGAVFMVVSVGLVFALLGWCLMKVLNAPPADEAE